MTNLEKSEKSKGVLLFAFNTKNINYVEIANRNSKLIEKFLNLPITLVTDSPDQASYPYHNIIFYDKHLQKKENTRFGYSGNVLTWKNLDRYSAYELSPYDITLILDVDCLILSKNLLNMFDTTIDYQILKLSHGQYKQVETKSTSQINHVWATCIIFRKTKKSELLFQLVDRIQNNYTYYRNLFYIVESNFRNDYAFAIADHILNGYSSNIQTSIPWSLLIILQKILAFRLLENNLIKIDIKDQKSLVVSLQDIHIVDKSILESNEFKIFVDQVYEQR